MNIVLLGAPGAGKGTQASRICEKYGIAHISTGDIFRKNISEKTELGVIAKSYIDKGELVPDEVTIGIVKNRILEDDCKNGFLLDGFPRAITQAEALQGFSKIDCAINIDVPLDRLLKRLTGRRVCPKCGESYHVATLGGETKCAKCGETLIQRADDNEQTVGQRLSVYTKQTAPLIDYYEKAGLLKTVNGDLAPDAVFAEIVEALEK